MRYNQAVRSKESLNSTIVNALSEAFDNLHCFSCGPAITCISPDFVISELEQGLARALARQLARASAAVSDAVLM